LTLPRAVIPAIANHTKYPEPFRSSSRALPDVDV
jgi:hypothetical protein